MEKEREGGRERREMSPSEQIRQRRHPETVSLLLHRKIWYFLFILFFLIFIFSSEYEFDISSISNACEPVTLPLDSSGS